MKEEIKKILSFSGKLIRFLAIILVIVSFINLFDLQNLFSRDIIVYPIVCQQKDEILNKCYNPEYTLARAYYRIIPSRQEVIYWVEDFSPKRLTKCAIVNKQNWSCEYDDGSAEFGFKNGKYYEISLKPSLLDSDYKNVYYSTSRIEYLRARCENSFLCMLLANLLE